MGNWLKKYLTIFKISWQSYLVYRLSFFLWRLRTLFWLLSSYFFWRAVYQNTNFIGSYSSSLMLTYILGTFILGDLVLSSLSIEIGPEIATGDLSNRLLQPFNYFFYWLARDWAHKLLNTLFIILEVFLIITILKPPLYFSKDIISIISLLAVLPLLLILNYNINLCISLLSFWFPEHNGWPQRFLFNTILMFLAGMYFPFDILPKIIALFLQFLPTGFLLFFPMQIILGRISLIKIFINIFIVFGWTLLLIKLNTKIWRQGLKKYGGEGR